MCQAGKTLTPALYIENFKMGIEMTVSTHPPDKRYFAGDVVEGTVEVKVDAVSFATIGLMCLRLPGSSVGILVSACTYMHGKGIKRCTLPKHGGGGSSGDGLRVCLRSVRMRAELIVTALVIFMHCFKWSMLPYSCICACVIFLPYVPEQVWPYQTGSCCRMYVCICPACACAPSLPTFGGRVLRRLF